MAIVSSLARALRETAERAILHARPPGHLKPPQARVPRFNEFKEALNHGTSPLFTTASPLSASPAARTASTLRGALRSFFDHAISPVFIGLKAPGLAPVKRTSRSQFHQLSGLNQFRSNPFQGIYRSKMNASDSLVKNGAESNVMKGFRCSGQYQGGANIVFAPSLGLRAAVDELDEKLRGLNKKEKMDQSKASRSRCSGNESLSSVKGRNWNLARYINDLDCACTLSPSVSVCSLHDSVDEESSCSSSTLDFLEQRANLLLAEDRLSSWRSNVKSDDNIHDEEVVRGMPFSFWTYFDIPLEPPQPSRPPINSSEDSLGSSSVLEASIVDDVAEISILYVDYDLQVIQPLHYAVRHGHLSRLKPEGWENPTAYSRIRQGGRQEPAFMQLIFPNCHADQVKEALRQDLTPLLYKRLQQYVHEAGVDSLGDPVAPDDEDRREEEICLQSTQASFALQFPQFDPTTASDDSSSMSGSPL